MGFITVTALTKDYLQNTPLQPITKKQSSYHLKKLIEKFGRRKASEITGNDLSRFVEEELGRGLALSTLSTRIRIFKAVIHWGIRTGRIKFCQVDSYRLPKGKARRIAPPDLKELQGMLEVCAPHIERVIRVGWHLGPRIGPSELLSLRWENIDLENGIIQMPNACKGASSDMRTLPLPANLLARMKKWKASESCEWFINWHGKKICHINKAFETTKRKAGIKRKFTPYSLRHAFATQALANGAPLKGVCAIMGHSSPRMVLEVYQHINFEILENAISKVSSL